VYYAHRSIDSSPGRIDVVAVVMVVAVMDDVDVGGATEEEEEDGPIIAAVHPHPRPPPSRNSMTRSAMRSRITSIVDISASAI
jgi:hypothetical protein